MTWKKRALIAGAAGALTLCSSGRIRAENLVTNGSFTNFTYDSSTQYPGSSAGGQLGYNTTVTGWTNTNNGYNFLFAPGTADDGAGVNGQYGGLQLWGPGNGSNNGLPATSPDGGNFIGADGAYNVGAITQTINGLTVGDTYTVGFYWGGAQQYGYTSPTTEQWVVGLGGETQSTAVLQNANHGFTGWQYQTFNYTATSTSEVLSFLAVGTPAGVPPFSLLDGVTLNVVPEPSTVVLLGLGLIGIGVVKLRRRAKAAVA